MNTIRRDSLAMSLYCSMMLTSSHVSATHRRSLADMGETNILANVEQTAVALMGAHPSTISPAPAAQGVKVSGSNLSVKQQAIIDDDLLTQLADAVLKHFDKNNIATDDIPLKDKIAVHFKLVGEGNLIGDDNLTTFQVWGNASPWSQSASEVIHVGQKKTKKGQTVFIFGHAMEENGARQLKLYLVFLPGGFQRATTGAHGKFSPDITNLDDDPKMKEIFKSSVEFWKSQLPQPGVARNNKN